MRVETATAWALGGLLTMAVACGGGGSPTSGGQPWPSTTVTTAASTTAPPSTAPTTTAATVRSVALGQTLSLKVGESVSVTGAGLSVTFTAVVSDSRCPAGVQCIQAGKAVITVTVARPGAAPVTLTLGTDGPKTARSGDRSVELVSLGRGQAPSAQLRVV